MSAVVPSFVAKIARAKEHLIELEGVVDAFGESRPYTVRQRIKGKGKVWRLEFTADPANTDIPIVVADVIYNLRSGLDHLMASLVPRKRRSSVMFPIMWEGVWEPHVPGDNADRIKQRERWQSCVKSLPDDAVAVLKALQPPDSNRHPDEVHNFALVNTLSNRDRHEKLPIVGLGLRQLVIAYTAADGERILSAGKIKPGTMFNDQAEIPSIPADAVDVKVKGVPAIAVKVGYDEGYVEIPEQLVRTTDVIESSIIPLLAPYVLPV